MQNVRLIVDSLSRKVHVQVLTHTYRSATAVVVQVHERPRISGRLFLCVYEGLGKLDPVVDVVAAASPVKLSPLVAGPPALVGVTVARLEFPLAAGAGQSVDHARRGDGVHERSFAAAWGESDGTE